MQSIYSNQLSLGHGYIKLNIKDESLLQDATELLNQKLSDLLSAYQGKIMHTKAYTTHTKNQKTAQVRCYFAYAGAPFQTKEQWVQFVTKNLGSYMEGQPTFVEMVPTSR